MRAKGSLAGSLFPPRSAPLRCPPRRLGPWHGPAGRGRIARDAERFCLRDAAALVRGALGGGGGGVGRAGPGPRGLRQPPAGGAAPRSRAAPLGRGAPQPSVAAVVPAPSGRQGPGGQRCVPDLRGRRSLPVPGQGGPSPARGALSPLFALLSSRRLVTLARGLAPAFLRFAGKRTDFLQFHNVKNPAKSRGGPGPDYYLKNYEDGELRVRGGERARQRGAAGTGRSCSACPALPAPGRGRAAPRSAAQRSARAVLPPYLLFPEREGAGGLRGARPPVAAGCGNKRSALGSGDLRIPPPPRRVLRLPSLSRPERAAPAIDGVLPRGPGTAVPGCLCTHRPALLPRVSGSSAFP